MPLGSPRDSLVGRIEIRSGAVHRTLKHVAPKAFDRALYSGIQAATIHLSGAVKNLLEGAVLKRRTGTLWRSIQPETFRRLGTVVGIVGTHIEYAPVHEFGAIIRPKSASGYLKFRAEGGDFVQVKRVDMPRRPFMSRAAREEENKIMDLIDDRIEREAIAYLEGRAVGGPGALPIAQRRGIAPIGPGGVGVI